MVGLGSSAFKSIYTLETVTLVMSANASGRTNLFGLPSTTDHHATARLNAKAVRAKKCGVLPEWARRRVHLDYEVA